MPQASYHGAFKKGMAILAMCPSLVYVADKSAVIPQ